MSNIYEILIIIGVIGFQTFSGHIGNKYLGSILPLVFTGIILYIVVSGHFSLSFRDILMPVIGYLALFAIYESAKESKKSKIRKEIEKMKAKDHIKQ